MPSATNTDREYESYSSSNSSLGDYLDRYGNEPLILAVREPEKLRLLLQHGFKSGASKKHVNMALFAAIEVASLQSVDLLLTYGADPNGTKPDSVAEYPFEVPECVYEADQINWSPLETAAQVPTSDDETKRTCSLIIWRLLDADADPWEIRCGPSKVRRSVFHAILAHGGRISPLLTHKKFENLNIEHRDPNGRTLLLSVCRSSLGADVAVTATLDDVEWDPEVGGYRRDPMPWQPSIHSQQALGANQDDDPESPPLRSSQSLLEKFVELGAHLTATDDLGKNVLHHLLDARDGLPHHYHLRTPLNRDSIDWILNARPLLLHQPDKEGTYPIHAAMQLLLHYPEWNQYFKRAGILDCLESLVSAGADPRQEDGHGKNAFDYLSSSNRLSKGQRDEVERILNLK